MILIYNNTSQSVASGGTISMPTTKILKGTSAISNGGTGVKLNRSGYYNITFDVSGIVTGGGNLVVSLYANGVAIPDATNTQYSTTDQNGALTINTIVQRLPDCCAVDNETTITAVVTGGAATISHASMKVTKLC